MKMFLFQMNTQYKFVSREPNDNRSAQIMAWHQIGDKPMLTKMFENMWYH